jgi:hypothetical protein
MFSCISDKFKFIQRADQLLELSIPEECFSSFISIMNLFHGSQLIYDDSELSCLIFLMKYFEFSFLAKLLSDKIPISDSLEESLDFLANPFSQYLEEYFQNAIRIVIEHFNEVSVQDFLSLPNAIIESIFSSDQLVLQNEDQLFSLIINLIQHEENRFLLLHLIHFEYVSSQLLIQFLFIRLIIIYLKN